MGFQAKEVSDAVVRLSKSVAAVQDAIGSVQRGMKQAAKTVPPTMELYGSMRTRCSEVTAKARELVAAGDAVFRHVAVVIKPEMQNGDGARLLEAIRAELVESAAVPAFENWRLLSLKQIENVGEQLKAFVRAQAPYRETFDAVISVVDGTDLAPTAWAKLDEKVRSARFLDRIARANAQSRVGLSLAGGTMDFAKTILDAITGAAAAAAKG